MIARWPHQSWLKSGHSRAAYRRFALLVSLGGGLLSGCSAVDEPGAPAEVVRKVAQSLEVLPPGEALEFLIPDVVDPVISEVVPSADAPVRGMWSAVHPWPLNGLHSVLLPSGQVLTFGTPAGRPANQDGRTLDVWDSTQGFAVESHATDFSAQRVNSFCGSAAFGPDGSLLISGGNSPLESSLFSSDSNQVATSNHRLASERWYGTMITLPDGQLLMLGGSDPYAALRAHENPEQAINAGSISMTPEIYEPTSGFRSLFGAYSREAFGPDHHRYWYPRAWVAPDGSVFGISSEQMWSLDYAGNGSIRQLGAFKTGVNDQTRPNVGPTSSAVMFAPGRILQVGGNGYYDGHATASSDAATIIDIQGATPVLSETGAMHHARQWASSTVLANGSVLVTGGTRRANNGGTDAVYTAELWNPESGEWTEGADAAVIRVYHSTAILLPNGAVLSTGGGAPGPVNNLNAEVYYPPHLFRETADGGVEFAPRPRVVAASTLSLDYGEVLNLDLAGSPVIQQAALIMASSATHSFNSSQRRLELPLLQQGGRVAVEFPTEPASAPPGYYLLFLLDADGVPSRGVMLSVGDSMSAPPVDVALPVGSETALLSEAPQGYAIVADNEGGAALAPFDDTSADEALHARYILREGLADPSCVSFESMAFPGWFLGQDEFRVELQAQTDSLPFESGATFCPEQGLSGTGVTFRAFGVPERVLRQREGEIWVEQVTDESEFSSATFSLWRPPLPALPSVDAPISSPDAELHYSPSISIPGANYSWNFGEGSGPTAESTSPDMTHSFATPGLHLVTLTVRLADGRRVEKNFYQAIAAVVAASDSSSSSLLALSRDGEKDRLWVVNPDNDSLAVVDPESRVMIAEIPVGQAPRSVAVAPDGNVWVVSRDDATISVIEPSSLEVSETISLPKDSRPYGLVFSPTANAAYVSLDGVGSVVELNVTTQQIVRSWQVGPRARGLALISNPERLLVSRFISPPVAHENSAAPSVELAAPQVTLLSLDSEEAPRSISIGYSQVTDSSVGGRGMPNYLGPPAISPDGRTAWIPSKQDNIARGVLRDGQDLDFQNTVRAVVSQIDLEEETESLADRLDLDNAGLVSAGVFHPSGLYFFAALETSREVAVIDALQGTELFRIAVGRAPQALILSEDGQKLFVKNFMDRTLSVLDLAPLVRHGEFESVQLETMATVGKEQLAPEVLLGKQLFYDAKDPRLARDGYLSCASCHAEGGDDGRVWDLTGLGEGVRNTISLLGFSQRTGLMHWSANFDEVQDFEGQIRELSGGSGLMSQKEYEQGTLSSPLGDLKAGLSPELDALAAYVHSLERVPPSPWRNGQQLTSAGRKGRKLFVSLACNECHFGENFASEASDAIRDIGTLTTASGKRHFESLLGIKVPSLRGAWYSAPYLHDGSAATLADAIDAHGLALSEGELAALVSYVEQIDDREPALAKAGLTGEPTDPSMGGASTGGSSMGGAEPTDGEEEPPEMGGQPSEPTEGETQGEGERDEIADASGCGCHAAGQGKQASLGWVLSLFLAGWAVRRRTRFGARVDFGES